MSLNVKVGLIGKLDMLKFKNLAKNREAAIQASPALPLPKTLETNEKAKFMHPEKQDVVISEIRPNGSDAKTIVLKSADGGPLAPFRAGQYVSVLVSIGGTNTTRSYSLCGSPAWAKRGEYNITVKRDDAGFVSPYIQDNWAAGQKIVISGPQGNLYYEPLRDAKKVVALAGGSGITPFMGMAYAILDGREDFDLTIIFGSRTADGIVYKKELDDIASACPRVHVVHVLSDEERPGFEHGFITSELIAKYGGEPGTYSIFMCGPQAMYDFLDGEIAKLNLRRKFVRRELFGAIKDPWNQPGYPMSKAESGKVELRLEPYPVEEFGQYITAVIGPLCLEKKQTLLFEPEKILSDVIPIFDHLRINQVVFNLLSNAVKYTPEGGSIRYRVAETKLSESSMTMHVDVIDNGIGMSEEFQKILFDPFTQEHRVDNSEMRGTGLGLAITKKLVDAMTALITAIAVSLVLENLAQAIPAIGPNPRTVDSIFAAGGVSISGATLSWATLITIIVSLVIMLVLYTFTRSTKLGRAMRAVSEDKQAATLMGISVNSTILITFAIGAGLAGVAALMYVAQYPAATNVMGLSPILVGEIFSIITELHKAGITILLVEQNAKMALSIADRAYVLETGVIKMSGPAKELAMDERIKKAYLGA